VKLVKKITGKAGQGVKGGDSPLQPEFAFAAPPRTKGGIVIDGVLTPLAGEPPIAKTNGWGHVPGF
jgi:hypothetical protein